MPDVTIYNDSASSLDCDFDVIELKDWKEVGRKTLSPDDEGATCFRLHSSSQMFLIVPRGVPCPIVLRPIIVEKVG